ncbi:MAG: DUF7782 domain-containing protein [Terriglobales bacterium]
MATGTQGMQGTAPDGSDAERCGRVRAALRAAGYNEEGITRTLGVDHLSQLRERRLPALLRRTRGGSPLETLARAFVLAQPVDEAAMARAAGPGGLEDWVALGLIARTEGGVRPEVQLRCYQGWVLAYDFARMGAGGLRPDYVMGVSPSSLLLAAMTVRREVETGLDMGSGCGIQALLAARHCRRVVGVDCNPRAVAMARFNAVFNGVTNVEFRLGDMFAPVEGETFDLIVSNPPFIISPDFRHLFLNSGWESDDASRRVVQEAPRHLRPGGYCVLNANWAVVEGEDWRARLAGWCAGSGCDGLVLQQETAEPDRYAATLIQTGEASAEEFARAFEQWMDYYAERRLIGIGSGVVVLRRESGRRNWFAVEPGPADIAVASGGVVEQLFELRSWLAGCEDAALLQTRLQLAGDVRLEQSCAATDGVWRPVAMRLHRTGGLGFVGTIDGPGAALLAGCDGTRTVREQIAALAGALGATSEAVTPASLGIIRRLIEQGFLQPAV